MTDVTQQIAAEPPADEDPSKGHGRRRGPTGGQVAGRSWGFFSVKNIGAIYVWIGIIVLFSIITPDVFPTWQTAKSILNAYAITGIVALALIIPLAAGVYDLSIGFVVSFAGVLVAKLLDETTMAPAVAVLIGLAACVVIGLINAFVVVALKVNSFIGTLGTGAIIASITIGISNNQTIIGRVGEGYSKFAVTDISGIQLPVIYLLVLMCILGYWLERTQSGRQIYATGFDRETARLSGARVNRLTVYGFLTSATIAGFAGMVLAARVSSGSVAAGSGYLIPAFSAAFLGATQLRAGRFNSWGTVIGVMLLGTGNVGLLISGGPTWTPQLFEGVVLIAAVALSSLERDAVRGQFHRLRRRKPPGHAAGGGAPATAGAAAEPPT